MAILTKTRSLAKNLLKESTRDKIEGLAKQAKGRVEAAAGELAGNSCLKARGAADQYAGEAQKRIGAIKRARGR
jgi:uncharacterized protein YjbJ (UPF0337 family)